MTAETRVRLGIEIGTRRRLASPEYIEVHPNLGACCRNFGRYRRRAGFHFFAIRLLTTLTNVDAALEEGAVFNGNTCSHDISSQGAITTNVDPVAGGQVAADLPQNHDFTRIDVGRNNAV